MKSPNSGGTSLPRKHIALLGLLLAALALSVYFREFRMASPSGALELAAPAAPGAAVEPDIMPARANPTVRQPPSPFRFTEIAKSAGIDFVHFSGMTDAKHFPTAYGSGVAIFDYDDDGRADLYLATATRLPVGSFRSGPNRLYRNRGNNQFEDVTVRSGLNYAGYCQGLAIGDVDNDGDADVFLCNYGSNVLYLNMGEGRFVDITSSAGLDRPGWATSAAFLDYDNDGDVDLYVANYGQWALPENDAFCGGPKAADAPGPEKVRIYCSPKSITPARHTLYRNNGDLTFTDLTEKAGLARTDGRGLGVVAADLNDDGRIDLYVANDMCPNFVFLNRGDGTFDDVTGSSGRDSAPRGRPARAWASTRKMLTATAAPTCSSPISGLKAVPCSSIWATGSSRIGRGPPDFTTTRFRGLAGDARSPISTATAGPTASPPPVISTTTCVS